MITGGAGDDDMTGDAGVDTFAYSGGSQAGDTAQTGTVATGAIDIITDFAAANDFIDFFIAGNGDVATPLNNFTAAGAAVTSYAAALTAANTALGGARQVYNLQAIGSGTSFTAVLFIDNVAAAGNADGAIQIGSTGAYSTAASALASITATNIV